MKQVGDQVRGWIGARWRSRVVLLAGAIAVLSLLGGIAVADENPPAKTDDADIGPSLRREPTPIILVRDARSEKLDSGLLAVVMASEGPGETVALSVAERIQVPVIDGRLRVVVEATTLDLTNARTAVLAAGSIMEAEYADTIQALVPPSGLDAIIASPDVRYVRAPAGMAPNQGPNRPSGISPG
jgi:hypothetical protein